MEMCIKSITVQPIHFHIYFLILSFCFLPIMLVWILQDVGVTGGTGSMWVTGPEENSLYLGDEAEGELCW